MILYSLRCAEGHEFEAWFRNGAAYDAQAAAGEIGCPICGARKIGKAPMAPRIGKSRGDDKSRGDEREAAPAVQQPSATPAGEDRQPDPAEIRQALSALRSRVESAFDYVGDRFPEEARRMHYKETEARPIYGEANETEVEALREEGVTFSRIPWIQRTDS